MNQETVRMVSIGVGNGVGTGVGNGGLPSSTATHCPDYFLRPAGKLLVWGGGATLHKLSRGGTVFPTNPY